MFKSKLKQVECSTLDEFLQLGLQTIKSIGVYRKPEWQRCGCYEIPFPASICLSNPLAPFPLLKARKPNIALNISESIWIASGMNDLDALPGYFAKSIYKYTDDGKTYRAGYGPRIRFYSGDKSQYHIGLPERTALLSRGVGYTDQLKFCVEQLKKDKFTRQAAITIHDPVKDDFDGNGNILKTVDTCCTRIIQFMCDKDGKLNCYVTMRSNDIIHGAGAINIAEFTFLQQLVAQVCGFPLGKYYHLANNLHYYEDMEEMVNGMLEEKIEKVPEMNVFSYDMSPITLEDVDKAIDIMLFYVASLAQGNRLTEKNPFFTEKRFQVFSDYAEVFRLFFCKKKKVDPVNGEFYHPMLQVLYHRGQLC